MFTQLWFSSFLAAILERLPASLQGVFMHGFVSAALLLVATGLLYWVARHYLLSWIHNFTLRSRTDWDETIFQYRAPHRAAALVPLLVLQSGVALVPGVPDEVASLLQRLLGAAVIWVAVRSIDALMSGAHEIYTRRPSAALRPIKSYVQLVKVGLYAFGAIFIVAQLLDQSPWFFVSGLGAAMAIVMLVFRDTLLSLVASIQLTNNDLVRVGDWIEMPQFGADGDVIDIALNTVRVQNWDKTISVIPTHKFLENSFRNWRGMQESGGRRIKRAIHINTSTVRFLSEEETRRFSRFALLAPYMDRKTRELQEYNAMFQQIEPGLVPNARRLTNLGTLRAYIFAYLRQHAQIHQEMTLLVRQLAPTPEGVPVEIYAFTNDTAWASYEGIQSDIFDHILSMVPEFDLAVYQRPSGHDVSHRIAAES